MKVKRIFSSMLSAALILGTLTIPAFAEEPQTHSVDSEIALTQALADAQDGDTIQFTQSFTLEAPIAVPKKQLTFDLNEKTISGATSYRNGIFEISGGNITIKNGIIKIVEDSYQARGAVCVLSSTDKDVRVVLDALVIDGSEENISTCVSVEANKSKNAQVEIKSGIYYGRYQYPICCSASDQLKFGKDVVVLSSDSGLGLVNGCPWTSRGTVSAIYPNDGEFDYEPEVTKINGYDDETNHFPNAKTKLVFVKFDPDAPERTLRLKETAKMYATIQDVVDDKVQDGYLDMMKASGSEDEMLPGSTIPAGVKITLNMNTNIGKGDLYYYGDIHVAKGGTLVLSGSGANTGVLGDLTWEDGATISFGNYVFGTYKTDITEWLPEGKAMEYNDETKYYTIKEAAVGIDGEPDKTYRTIAEALADDQKNIKLKSNHQENVVIGSTDGISPAAEDPITIDLNGNKLSGMPSMTEVKPTVKVNADAEVIIKDSSGKKGRITAGGYNKGLRYAVENQGTLTLENVELDGESGGSYAGESVTNLSVNAIVRSNGQLTINNCKIENQLNIEPNGAPDRAETCDGGIGVLVYGGNTAINDSTIWGGYNGVYVSGGHATIDEKSVADGSSITFSANNDTPPSGGRQAFAADAADPSMLTIYGGKYNSDVSAFLPANRALSGSGNPYTVVSRNADTLPETVRLVFEHNINTQKDNEYDIVIESMDPSKSIYRFMSAQIAFELTGDLSYEIVPAEGVNIVYPSAPDGLYEFNLDGVTASSKNDRIRLGTLHFKGYGSAAFRGKAGADNQVQTGYYDAVDAEGNPVDNSLVYTYNTDGSVAPGSAKTGTFKIYSGEADDTYTDTSTQKHVYGTIDDVTISEPTTTLDVAIAFNNNITKGNSVEYNQMTVTVAGSNGKTFTGKLGTGESEPEVVYADGAEKVTFTFEEVPVGYNYTVTVDAPGYRTARKSINLPIPDEGAEAQAVTVNFWNNVMDQARPMVTGDKSPVKTNFLAGDIIAGNGINIYDLSAVVSYFGEDNLAANHPNYNKYDLNRDGKIDSKDVAYVLVSWGN